MPSPMLGVIPAAGSGIRARPYTYEMHKGMFAIDGSPNLERLIRLMRDDLGIEEIVIVLGYMGETIRDYFGDGSSNDVKINYVDNHHLDKGWAWSVLLAKPYLAGRTACVMLCDEFYLGTNHVELRGVDLGDASAIVATKTVEDPELIKKNFSVEQDGNRIIRLVENPVSTPNNTLGMANFVLKPEVLTVLEDAYDSGRPTIEFVNFIDELIRDGHIVRSFELEGEYINLNDVASMEAAQDLAIRTRTAD